MNELGNLDFNIPNVVEISFYIVIVNTKSKVNKKTLLVL